MGRCHDFSHVNCSPERNATVFRPAQVKQQSLYFLKRETAPWVALTTGPEAADAAAPSDLSERERLCSATGWHPAGLLPPKPGHPRGSASVPGTQEAALVCTVPRGLRSQPEPGQKLSCSVKRRSRRRQLPGWWHVQDGRPWARGPHREAGRNTAREFCRVKGQTQNTPEIRW